MNQWNGIFFWLEYLINEICLRHVFGGMFLGITWVAYTQIRGKVGRNYEQWYDFNFSESMYPLVRIYRQIDFCRSFLLLLK